LKIRLQQTGYQESPYERPTQKWVCGHASDDKACSLGPDAKGKCTAHAQTTCTPVREGDRWVCTRLGVYGGPCKNGPNPDGSCCRPAPEISVCQPRLSTRARRRRLAWSSVALITGLLAIALNGPWAAQMVSPGGLSHAHLAIEGAEGVASNCGVCHAPADSEHAGLLGGGLGMPDRLAQSQNCLKCHFDQARDVAMRTHSVDEDQLAAWMKDAGQTNATPTIALAAAVSVPRPHLDLQSDIACATCHIEHRGKAHNLSRLSDTQCQVCHSSRFTSFNDGHPEFDLAPRSRTGIAFDHKQHEDSGFGQRPFNCADCHEPDAAGVSMTLKPYDESCMGCHNQGMEDRHGTKIKDNSFLAFQLPFMEVEDVYWPEDAAYGEDELPVLMRLLLLGDDEALPGLRSIDEDADGIPFDWIPDEPEPVGVFTKAVKRLLDDLANGDEDALRERLAKALGPGVEHGSHRVSALAESLAASRFAMLAYQQRWLPLLADDLAGDEVEDDPVEGPEWALSGAQSGWYVDEGDVAVYYKPMGHADPVIKGLLDGLMDVNVTGVNPTGDDLYRVEQAQSIVEQLTGDGSFARSACLKCHSVESETGQINWSAANRSASASGFGKFNHRPHMAMLRDAENCSMCHMKPSGEGEAPEILTHGGFVPHTQATCASCHAPGQAENSCLNCHSYHHHRP
jgi:hypothetical protein